MSPPRFYVPTELYNGQKVDLPENVSHHLLSVLRMKPGDAVTIYNGKGGEFHAEVLETSNKFATVSLNGYADINRNPSIDIYYGLCVLKKNAMNRAIIRCVEMGVHALTPIISENCTVSHRIISERHNHWKQTIIAASEQCGLNILPSLEPAVPLFTWLNSIEADLKLIASLDGGRFPNGPNAQSVAIVTGPEGGFTEKELREASQAKFKSVKLGARILRGENAPVVALSAIHQRWGDFSD